MQTQVYEGLFIFDSNKYARDHAGLPGEVEKMVTDLGGEVLVSRLWEERRLAYPIAGQRKGTYWLVYFRTETGNITPLNRKCELNEGVLRQLILKIHPSLVDPILEHASGVVVEEDEPAEEAAGEEATEEATKETVGEEATEATPSEATPSDTATTDTATEAVTASAE